MTGTDELQPVTRPDGRLYRPRKAPYAWLTGYDGDIEGVIVCRTHDVERARALAQRALDSYDTGGELLSPSLHWGHWRPDRAIDGLAWEEHQDGATGTPAVWFSVDWVGEAL